MIRSRIVLKILDALLLVFIVLWVVLSIWK